MQTWNLASCQETMVSVRTYLAVLPLVNQPNLYLYYNCGEEAEFRGKDI
jgi:hypothetical protein